jgi:hypothetical protein
MSIKPRRNRLNVRRRVLKSFLGHTKPGSVVILARRTQQTSRRTNSVSTPDAAALQPDVTRQEGNWYQQDAYACGLILRDLQGSADILETVANGLLAPPEERLSVSDAAAILTGEL